MTVPEVAAYYVEPVVDKQKKRFRLYGPFQHELDAFRAAFFMLSYDLLYASSTSDFALEVMRNFTFHEPGELAYILMYGGYREIGYKEAKLLPPSRVPVHPSWKAHNRAYAEHHVLNNARAAKVISKSEETRVR